MKRKIIIFIILNTLAIFTFSNILREKEKQLITLKEKSPEKFKRERLYVDLFLIYYELEDVNKLWNLADKYGEDKLLGDFILIKSGELLDKNGEKEKARKLFFRLIKRVPHSKFFKEAYFNLGKSYFESKKTKLAIKTLKKYVRRYRKNRSKAYFMLGKAHLEEKNYPKATYYLLKIINYSRNHKLKGECSKILSENIYHVEKYIKSKKTLLKILSILLKNRYLKEAKVIIDLFQKRFGTKDNLFKYYYARYFFLESHYLKSEKVLKEIFNKINKNEKRTLLQVSILLSRIYSILGKERENKLLIEDILLKRKIYSEFLLDELLYIHIKNKKLEESERLLKKIIPTQKITNRIKLYKKLALLYFREGENTKCENTFKKILKYEKFKYLKRKIDFDGIRYLYTSILLENGKKDKAREIISENLKTFYSFYYFPSLEIFKKISQTEDIKIYKKNYQSKKSNYPLKYLSFMYYLSEDKKTFRENFRKNFKRYYEKIERIKNIRWLNGNISLKKIPVKNVFPYLLKKSIQLRCYKLSPFFLKRTPIKYLRRLTGLKGNELKIFRIKSLIKFYTYEENHPRVIYLSYNLLKNTYPPYFPVQLIDKNLLKNVYPIYYHEEVVKNSQKAKLDPNFIFSLIREESKFDKNAHSITSARGLMQLMDKTAIQIIKENNLKINFSPNILYTPKINIELGCLYVKKLKERLKRKEYISSAYNSGETNTLLWIKTFNTTFPEKMRSNFPYLFVNFIKFRETKNYVKKVIKSFFMYTFLYNNHR